MNINKSVKKLLYIAVILTCSSSQPFAMNMKHSINSNIQPNTNRLMNIQNNNMLVNNQSKKNVFDGLKKEEIVEVIIEICKVRPSLIQLIREVIAKHLRSQNKPDIQKIPDLQQNDDLDEEKHQKEMKELEEKEKREREQKGKEADIKFKENMIQQINELTPKIINLLNNTADKTHDDILIALRDIMIEGGHRKPCFYRKWEGGPLGDATPVFIKSNIYKDLNKYVKGEVERFNKANDMRISFSHDNNNFIKKFIESLSNWNLDEEHPSIFSNLVEMIAEDIITNDASIQELDKEIPTKDEEDHNDDDERLKKESGRRIKAWVDLFDFDKYAKIVLTQKDSINKQLEAENKKNEDALTNETNNLKMANKEINNIQLKLQQANSEQEKKKVIEEMGKGNIFIEWTQEDQDFLDYVKGEIANCTNEKEIIKKLWTLLMDTSASSPKFNLQSGIGGFIEMIRGSADVHSKKIYTYHYLLTSLLTCNDSVKKILGELPYECINVNPFDKNPILKDRNIKIREKLLYFVDKMEHNLVSAYKNQCYEDYAKQFPAEVELDNQITPEKDDNTCWSNEKFYTSQENMDRSQEIINNYIKSIQGDKDGIRILYKAFNLLINENKDDLEKSTLISSPYLHFFKERYVYNPIGDVIQQLKLVKAGKEIDFSVNNRLHEFINIFKVLDDALYNISLSINSDLLDENSWKDKDKLLSHLEYLEGDFTNDIIERYKDLIKDNGHKDYSETARMDAEKQDLKQQINESQLNKEEKEDQQTKISQDLEQENNQEDEPLQPDDEDINIEDNGIQNDNTENKNLNKQDAIILEVKPEIKNVNKQQLDKIVEEQEEEDDNEKPVELKYKASEDGDEDMENEQQIGDIKDEEKIKHNAEIKEEAIEKNEENINKVEEEKQEEQQVEDKLNVQEHVEEVPQEGIEQGKGLNLNLNNDNNIGNIGDKKEDIKKIEEIKVEERENPQVEEKKEEEIKQDDKKEDIKEVVEKNEENINKVEDKLNNIQEPVKEGPQDEEKRNQGLENLNNNIKIGNNDDERIENNEDIKEVEEKKEEDINKVEENNEENKVEEEQKEQLQQEDKPIQQEIKGDEQIYPDPTGNNNIITKNDGSDVPNAFNINKPFVNEHSSDGSEENDNFKNPGKAMDGNKLFITENEPNKIDAQEVIDKKIYDALQQLQNASLQDDEAVLSKLSTIFQTNRDSITWIMEDKTQNEEVLDIDHIGEEIPLDYKEDTYNLPQQKQLEQFLNKLLQLEVVKDIYNAAKEDIAVIKRGTANDDAQLVASNFVPYFIKNVLELDNNKAKNFGSTVNYIKYCIANDLGMNYLPPSNRKMAGQSFVAQAIIDKYVQLKDPK